MRLWGDSLEVRDVGNNSQGFGRFFLKKTGSPLLCPILINSYQTVCAGRLC